MTDISALPIITLAAGAIGAWLASTRYAGPPSVLIRLDKMHYRLGEAIVADISVDAASGISFDEAVLSLYCEDRLDLTQNGRRSHKWRRLFAKASTMRAETGVEGQRKLRFSACMALPECSRDDIKGIFTLSDMARLMRSQLSGEGLPSRRASDRPGERLLQLAERHRFDDAHWRLELNLLKEGRSLLSHRVDVPVRGFASRSEEAPQLQEQRAA